MAAVLRRDSFLRREAVRARGDAGAQSHDEQQQLVAEEVVEGGEVSSISLHTLPPPPGPGVLANERFSSFAHLVAARRSCRDFEKDAAVALDDLANVLYACQGKTLEAPEVDSLGHSALPRRAAPSGGAAYPLSVYVAIGARVHGLMHGLYKYDSGSHSLFGPLSDTKVDAKSALDVLASTSVPHDSTPFEVAAGHQTWIGNAAALILITGDAAITAAKGGLYGRFKGALVTLEAGMAAENALLMATARGLGACPVGAFEGSDVDAAFRNAYATDTEAPVIMVALGVPVVL